MIDRLLATGALLVLIAFVGIVVVFVRELDLILVVLIALALALYDLWVNFVANRAKNGS